PDAGRDRAKARPSTDSASTFFLRKGSANDGQTAWNEKRGAKSLNCASSDQLPDIPSESTSGRCQRKERDTNEKNAPAPIMIAERTADEQERGEQKRISFDDPLQIRSSGVEACLQGGQRDVDDGAIDEGHAGSEDCGCEYPATP